MIWRNLLVLQFWFSLGSSLCPMRCACHEDKLVVNCQESTLNVVPITLNPELRELYLSSNQIKSITASFNFYRNLEYLDLSGNLITTVGKKDLSMQRNLRVLFLNENKIKDINNHSFYGLQSLQFLNLKDNLLERLSNRVFAGLNKLDTLDLSRNRIKDLSSEAFSGLIHLKTLVLRDNKLRKVPSPSFNHIPNLVKLDLSQNSFHHISDFAFSPLKNLEEMSLNDCEIAAFSPSAFHNVNHLHKLGIEENSLTEMPTEALVPLKNLEQLIIGKNRISRIEAFALRGTPRLKTLIIRGDNQLNQIDKSAFLSNPYLSKFILEFCPNVDFIEDGTFTEQRSLKYLSLRGNQIPVFSSQLLDWESLEYLDVRENPLHCNCSLEWMWESLRQSNASIRIYAEELICAEPPNLSGLPFLSLSLTQMDCYDSLHPQIITGSLIVALICAISSILMGFWCRTRFPWFMKKKKYETSFYPSNLRDDLNYEKGTIIDNQVIFPHHLGSAAISIHNQRKTPTISHL